MNKKLLTLLLVIILFIPSFVAIGYYSSTRTGPNSQEDVNSLVLKDPNGEEWTFSSDDGNADSAAMIDLFFGIGTRATKVDSLPEAVESGTKFFLVTITSFGREQSYRYYFTNNPAESYYVDNTGENVYKIAEDDCKLFLSMSRYSSSISVDASVPVLIVGGEGGTRVLPSAAMWNYRMYSGGDFVSLDTTPFLSDEEVRCVFDDGFDLNFTEAPDLATLVVTDGEGNEIFRGAIENMDELSLGDISEFRVSITAEWLENSEKDFSGTATYSFVGEIVEPATFYLGQSTVENGKFIVIGGKNVSDPSKIQFTSEPAINYTPTFYGEGDYVYALVPISYELEDGTEQNYTFTIKYGGTSQEMNLVVTSYKYKPASSSISASVEAMTYSEEARAEAEAALHELAKKEVLDTHAFSGTFLKDVVGPGSSEIISSGFGRPTTVTATGTKYIHTGTDYYVADQDSEVFAVNDGQVVYSGNLTTTGYIVVIDHGWGLKSWYCHLSKCSVEVGDTVSKGDVIGLSGSTGFTMNKRVHVGLTVSDVPVCIYALWDTPLAIPDMTS